MIACFKVELLRYNFLKYFRFGLNFIFQSYCQSKHKKR